MSRPIEAPFIEVSLRRMRRDLLIARRVDRDHVTAAALHEHIKALERWLKTSQAPPPALR